MNRVIQDFESCERKDYKLDMNISHFNHLEPTFWQICAKTCPLESFLCDGLNRFSVEIQLVWLKLPNLTLKLQLQSLNWSLGLIEIPPPYACWFRNISSRILSSFLSNTVKISGPNRSVKVTDHFTCITANVIYCITCTLCKKIYIGETGRRLADRFREHLRDAEQNNTDASKPVARYFNLPNHSHHNMTICGLSLHHGNTESRKNLEQKFIFQLGTLSPHGINERLSFH